MTDRRSDAFRRGLGIAAILVMSGFVAFGRLQRDGWAFNEYDAQMHFAASATFSLLAVTAWPHAPLSCLFVGLAILAGITELLQFGPGLDRTPSWSDFGFNICGIAATLGIIAAVRAITRN